ncbi:hypothetical protein ES703_102277 [subsurface metagenome]
MTEKNKGAIFSIDRKGEDRRLQKWLGLPGIVNGALSRALAKLSPGHRIPLPD